MKYKLIIAIVLALFNASEIKSHDFSYNGLFYKRLSTTDRTLEVTSASSDSTSITIPQNINAAYAYGEWSQESKSYWRKLNSDKSFDGCMYYVAGPNTHCLRYSFQGPCTIKFVYEPHDLGWSANFTIGLMDRSIDVENGIYERLVDGYANKESTITYTVDDNATHFVDFRFISSTGTDRSVSLYLESYETTANYTVTTIGDNAFKNNSNLTSISLPETVTSIGKSAFQGCNGLTHLSIPSTIHSLSESVFSDCTGLTSVEIPNSVTAISSSAFSGCSGLTSVEIPNSVTTISSNAFSGCTGLTSVNIPNSVTSIGNNAFSECYSLKSLTIPASVQAIGSNAFAESGLRSITIEDGIEEIGKGVFQNCYELRQISFPVSLKKISNRAFTGCSKLASMTVHGSFDYTYDSSYSSDRKDYFIHDNYTTPLSIDKVFWLHNTEPKVKGKVTYVSTSNVSTDDELKRYDFVSSLFEQDGVIYIPISPSQRTAMVVDVNYGQEQNLITIPKTVTYKGIGLNVIDAGNYSFSRYDDVEHFNIEAQLPSIPDGFAYECSALKDFTVNSAQTYIGKHAFEGCTSLETFVMLDGQEDVEVGIDAFRNAGLKTLRQGRQLVYPDIEANSPFAGNATLEKVWLTDIPTSVGPYQFKDCPKLSKVNIGDRIEAIEHYAFSGCRAIESFAFGSAVTRIEDEAFSDCTGMKDLYAEPMTPPVCGSQALDDINRWECTLHVMSESETAYAEAPQWKEFLFKDNTFGISINPTSIHLFTGESRQLYVTDNNGDDNVTWMSTNTDVISVSESGLVTAIAAGSASVVAINSAGLMANCQITVDTPAESISLNYTEITLKASETIELQAKTLPETTTNKSLTWKSDNESIATVDDNGIVTAISIGHTMISVTAASGVTAQCDVTVVETPAEAVEIDLDDLGLSGGNLKMEVGDTKSIKVTITPETTTDKSVSFLSSDPTVAAVDDNGTLTALSIGTATITVSAKSGASASFKVTVIAPRALSISLDPSIISAIVGSEVQLTVNIMPEASANQPLIWKSGNEKIATVSSTGLVTIHSVGSTTIEVSTTDGSDLTAICEISGLSSLSSILSDKNTTVDVYNLQGICVKRNATKSDLESLQSGVYIIAGNKVILK